jgi:hypothetical protein
MSQLGQNAKNSLRAYIFRYSLQIGHREIGPRQRALARLSPGLRGAAWGSSTAGPSKNCRIGRRDLHTNNFVALVLHLFLTFLTPSGPDFTFIANGVTRFPPANDAERLPLGFPKCS